EQINKNDLLENFKNSDRTNASYKPDPIYQRFIDKLKLATTWRGDKFSENSFAAQSDHHEYAEMISSDFFINIITKYKDPNQPDKRLFNDKDMEDFITVALTEGQD